MRHTQVTGVEGLCYGRLDVALAASFADEAAAVRAALPAGDWRLLVSPALRCRRLAETFGQAATIDGRLAELHFGDWEGRAWNDIPRAELDAWSEDFIRQRPPGGESFADLIARAEAVIADLGRARVDMAVAVTHAGIIRALLAPRLGMSYAEAFDLEVPPGSLSWLPE